MKASEAYANFNIFESQCPKIRILSKALNAKLSKCPQWSHQSIDALRLLDHPSQRCLRASISWCENLEVCRTSGV